MKAAQQVRYESLYQKHLSALHRQGKADTTIDVYGCVSFVSCNYKIAQAVVLPILLSHRTVQRETSCLPILFAPFSAFARVPIRQWYSALYEAFRSLLITALPFLISLF